MAIQQSDLPFEDGVPQLVPASSFVTLVIQTGHGQQQGSTLATFTIDNLQVAAMTVPIDPAHNRVQTLSAYVPAGAAGYVTLFGHAPYLATLSSWPLVVPPPLQGATMKFENRYYQLGQAQPSVRITATDSFLVNVVAENGRGTEGKLNVTIYDAAGAGSAVTLTVPPRTGLSLGAVGAASGGAVLFSGDALTTFDVILTVETATTATVTYSR